MAEDLLARVVGEIRERRQAAQAAYEESRRLERALAALGSETSAIAGSVTEGPRREQRPARRRRRAAPGANREAILAAVRERPGASAGEIAQATGIARSTVSPTLSRLIAAGAVERTELPSGGVGFRPAAQGTREAAGGSDGNHVSPAEESAQSSE
jgi:DNA-binding transcriptional ArsR family regulator